MFGSSVFWHVRKLQALCRTFIHLLRKKLHHFGWVEVSILVGKWNIYEAHIFKRSLVQKRCLETTTLCSSTRLRVKIFFYILNIFVEIYVTFWLLCAHPLIWSIIYHTRGPNTQDNVNYVLDFYVPADVHFSHFEDLKFTFFTYIHFALRVMY